MTHNLPEMTPVRSSNLHSVGHDGTALYVSFRDSKGNVVSTYRYPTATSEHHRAMLEASSAGAYFHATVKNRHTGVKVG
jgi:hypothetical protein